MTDDNAEFDALAWQKCPTLADFLADAEPRLTRSDWRDIVDQAIRVLQDYYVHLPMKAASHGIEPVQQLLVLRRHLAELSDDLAFHARMYGIFAGLQDLHTNYLMPMPYADRVAFLPFQFDACRDGERRRFIVTHALKEATKHAGFGPGAEIIAWNGAPIARAVERAAVLSGGANPPAQTARGILALTYRPMAKMPPPDGYWVHVAYRGPHHASGTEKEERFAWRVAKVPDQAGTSGGAQPHVRSLDIELDAVRRLRQRYYHSPKPPSGHGVAATPVPVIATRRDIFEAATLRIGPHRVGSIRIRTFHDTQPDRFVAEFARLLRHMPPEGLILDVRNNGGGSIEAAERILQLLTPNEIEPARFQFIATEAVQRLCAMKSPKDDSSRPDLSPWLPSITQALQTGGRYSAALPMTPHASCNNIGQRYFGPVVLLVNALCYSAADIFIAGFQDNRVGMVLGVHRKTGAGGANVWTLDQLQSVLGPPEAEETRLPHGAGLRLAIRRSLRVKANEGIELEERGVVPDKFHETTLRDLLENRLDLLTHAATLLAGERWFQLDAGIRAKPDGAHMLLLTTRGIERLDATIEGRPLFSRAVPKPAAGGDGTSGDHVTLAADQIGRLELRGFRKDKLVAARKLTVRPD